MSKNTVVSIMVIVIMALGVLGYISLKYSDQRGVPQTYTTTNPYTTITTNPSYTGQCISTNGLPDPRCTPGAIDPNVTQSNIQSTICVSGYTAGVRPSTSYTEPLKIKQIQQYGYSDTNPSDYEEDHLISLELGGNPTSPSNLWPESHYGNFTSYQKDALENYLHSQVCSGAISLAMAQQEIATNWVQAYEQYKGH